MQRFLNVTASFLILLVMLFLCGCETSQPARTSPTLKSAADSGSSSGPYARTVYRAYERAWRPLDSWPNGERVTKASVTVARDGRVISARIVGSSGDVWMDKSVREALDKVRVVAPFENGAKENHRTFIINFDSKSMDG